MEKIENQLRWYRENANSLYDDIIFIELEKINSLYERYDDHSDEIFVEEMIESFCKIIERQREKINDLELEVNSEASAFGDFTAKPTANKFISLWEEKEDFKSDKQLQESFTKYCLNKGKSSYTVNDYCSRIKNLWKGYWEEKQVGNLPCEIDSDTETAVNSPLLNVFNNADIINRYINMKIAENEGNRNLANARAAFNKFDEFRMSVKG